MSFILFLLFANELSSKNNQTVFDKSKSLKENTLKNDTFDWLLKPIITTINIYRIADLQ